VHEIMDEFGYRVPVIAKIEKPQAVENLDAIVQAFDGIMVARGDLGVEMPLEDVPLVQKSAIELARREAKPVIVATQVLESMIVEARPTRAEVNDAANAVDDGVDAIMLAGETAAGAHPVKAVQTLDAIIRDAELTEIRLEGPFDSARLKPRAPAESLASPAQLEREASAERSSDDHQDALCQAAVTLAEGGHAQAIVAITQAGHTARRLSAKRPNAPIVAITSRSETARQVSMYWGVVPLLLEIGDDVESSGTLIRDELLKRGLAPAGGTVVLIRIHDDISRSDANYLKIRRL
jgi:pyruvate kinase